MENSSWKEIYLLDTAPSLSDRENDEWDGDFNVNYSSDGKKLLDGENFPNEVTVREGVEIICDGVFAFEDYMAEDYKLSETVPEEERVSYLDKISLPNSITHIGKEAFRECGALKSIKLPTSLQVIGDSAFENCWSLRSIACPSSLQVIGDYAFGECFSLEKVRLNKDLKAIGPYAFFYCESLVEISIPDSVEYIGEDAFKCCKSLKKIYVPKGTKEKFAQMIPGSLSKKIKEI